MLLCAQQTVALALSLIHDVKRATRKLLAPLPTQKPGEKLWLVHLPFGMNNKAATCCNDLKRHVVSRPVVRRPAL